MRKEGARFYVNACIPQFKQIKNNKRFLNAKKLYNEIKTDTKMLMKIRTGGKKSLTKSIQDYLMLQAT